MPSCIDTAGRVHVCVFIYIGLYKSSQTAWGRVGVGWGLCGLAGLCAGGCAHTSYNHISI